MPDKINLSKLYHDNETQWLARFIIGMMKDPKKNWPRAIEPDGSFDNQAEAEICLTIDGVEVPLLDALNGWSDSFDTQVKEGVKVQMEASKAKCLYALQRATEAYTDGLSLYTKNCPFWIVSKPTYGGSELGDVLLETTIADFAKQARGGFDEDSIVAVFALEYEEEAEKLARRMLAEIQQERPR